jgi:hypothetical protein
MKFTVQLRLAVLLGALVSLIALSDAFAPTTQLRAAPFVAAFGPSPLALTLALTVTRKWSPKRLVGPKTSSWLPATTTTTTTTTTTLFSVLDESAALLVSSLGQARPETAVQVTALVASSTLDPTTALSDVLAGVIGTPMILAIPILAAVGLGSLIAFLIVSYANPVEPND